MWVPIRMPMWILMWTLMWILMWTLMWTMVVFESIPVRGTARLTGATHPPIATHPSPQSAEPTVHTRVAHPTDAAAHTHSRNQRRW